MFCFCFFSFLFISFQDDKLAEMFGEGLDVNDPDALLTLEKYVSAMRLGQLKQMREKTMNKTKSSSTLNKSKRRY